jgi:hypothetical protein
MMTRQHATVIRVGLVLVSLLLLVALGAIALHLSLPFAGDKQADILKPQTTTPTLTLSNISSIATATYPQSGVPSEIPVTVHITRNPGYTALPPRDQDYTDAASVKALWDVIWHLPFTPVQGDSYCPSDDGLSYDIRFTFIDISAISGHAQASGCSGLVIGGRGTLALTPTFWETLQTVMGEPVH